MPAPDSARSARGSHTIPGSMVLLGEGALHGAEMYWTCTGHPVSVRTLGVRQVPNVPPALPGGILEQDALMANDLYHNSMGHFGSDRKPRGNPTLGEPCPSLTEVLYVTIVDLFGVAVKLAPLLLFIRVALVSCTTRRLLTQV